MIKINYFNSESGEPVCFEFEFFKGEYIPERYFAIADGQSVQMLFFEDILKRSGLLRSKESKAPFCDFYWNCSVEGVEFVMHYDSEWDMLDFSVSDAKYRSVVALKLKHLIELHSIETKAKVS